jgi:hypothetical protein
LTSIHKTIKPKAEKAPRIAKPKVEKTQIAEIIIDMPVCGSVFETITYEVKSVNAVLVDFSDVKSDEDSEPESYVNEEEEFVKWSKM